MEKYAKIIGNCLVASEDGSKTEVLTGCVGKCFDFQDDAIVLKVGDRLFPVPSHMVEIISDDKTIKEEM